MIGTEFQRLTPRHEWQLDQHRRRLALKGQEHTDIPRWAPRRRIRHWRRARILSYREIGPIQALLWRWWRALAIALVGATVAGVALIVGVRGSADETWPSIVAGFGSGVLGSALVALVVLSIESRNESIRSVESNWMIERKMDYLYESLSRDIITAVVSIDREIVTDIGAVLDDKFGMLSDEIADLEDRMQGNSH